MAGLADELVEIEGKMYYFVEMDKDDPRLSSDLFVVLKELRTDLTLEQLLLVHAEGYPQGLRFTAVYSINEDATRGECVAVAGWRITWLLFTLKRLYVDDLVARSSERSAGVGRALMDYLERKASANGCKTLELDSGVQRGRAHKFYFREGFTVNAFHFSKPLHPY